MAAASGVPEATGAAPRRGRAADLPGGLSGLGGRGQPAGRRRLAGAAGPGHVPVGADQHRADAGPLRVVRGEFGGHDVQAAGVAGRRVREAGAARRAPRCPG